MLQIRWIWLLIATLFWVNQANAQEAPIRQIDRPLLEDKIRGGWAGKMIGVAYGAPTEFRYNARINTDPINWQPDQVKRAIGQDDLYVGMTLAETMDRLGLDATTRQYGEAFRDSKYRLWHANAAARRLLSLGIAAPDSGHPKYNIHANDIDFQIEADFIGLMCPGLPRQSNFYCDRVGRVMNYGDGLYGGMFVCGMYAAAYFESDPRKVVEQGLACLPASSEYARLIQDVLDGHQRNPDDWHATWRVIEAKWNKHDSCIDGALDDFNIDAKINGGYVAMGLLFGNGDFGKTIEVATRAGQDSDCNPSSAAGVLGVILGYKSIPEEWCKGIPAVEDLKFEYTRSSLKDICRSTLTRMDQVVAKVGGKLTETELSVPIESPEPAPLEQWSMGIPKQRIHPADEAIRWSEGWSDHKNWRGPYRLANEKGQEFTVKFSGRAIALVGDCTPAGGRAEVWLDGQKAHAIDAYANESTFDNALWHIYGLEAGAHTLRVVLSGEKDDRSQGTEVRLQSAVIYD